MIYYFSMGTLSIISITIALLLPPISFIFLKQKRIIFKQLFLCIYCIVILYLTIFAKPAGQDRCLNLLPFSSYNRFDTIDVRWQIFMNILLFVPFGFLLPFTFKNKLSHTGLIALIFSFVIEITQYITKLGFCEIDDIIHNVFGALIGFIYFLIIKNIWNKEQLKQ